MNGSTQDNMLQLEKALAMALPIFCKYKPLEMIEILCLDVQKRTIKIMECEQLHHFVCLRAEVNMLVPM